jgi:hypothetical protein
LSLLDTIDFLATKKPEPFVAPVPFAHLVSVRTIQDGVTYSFSVQNPRPGWWTLVPAGVLARIDTMAQPADVIDYLNELPRFYVIALFPTSETTWLVTPYSIADAEQRGWMQGRPREVHLVRMAVEPFDVLVTRNLAGTLIFDDIDTRLGTHTITNELQEAINNEERFVAELNWRNAYQTVYQRTQQLLKEQKQAEQLKRITEQKMDTEEAIRWQLEFMGAKLKDVQHSRNGYTVYWTAPDGRSYDMQVGKNLHIEVAGFCLAGTDRVHNLSSIVHVMEEAVRQHRPDLPGESDYDDDD